MDKLIERMNRLLKFVGDVREVLTPDKWARIEAEADEFRTHVGTAYTALKDASDDVVVALMIVFETMNQAQSKKSRAVKPLQECASIKDLAGQLPV
jgi:nitrogen regulatory protein PII-like uncharacterized protein